MAEFAVSQRLEFLLRILLENCGTQIRNWTLRAKIEMLSQKANGIKGAIRNWGWIKLEQWKHGEKIIKINLINLKNQAKQIKSEELMEN